MKNGQGKPRSRTWLRTKITTYATLLAATAAIVGFASTQIEADADPPTITEQNKVFVAEQFAPEIAADPQAATLDPELQARVDQAGASMTADERAVFVAGVQAAVVRIRNGEYGASEQARFAAALRKMGYTAEQADALKADPIAMNTIPVTAVDQPTVPGDRNRVEEEIFVGPDGKEYGFTRTAAPNRCPAAAPALKSTYPQMWKHWESWLGVTLASVSWYKQFCWGSNVVSAVSGEEPHFNPTGNCVGCNYEVTWTDAYHYDYMGNPWSGYANKVNFNIEQCYYFGQCMRDYHYWQMNMHGDGTLWWTYER